MRNPGSRFSSGLEQWTRLKGKPFVTVSPSTTPDGSDFGAFTPGTSTSGIQEAINYIASSEFIQQFGYAGTVKLLAGTFKISVEITFPAGAYVSIEGSGMVDTQIMTVASGISGLVNEAANDFNFRRLRNFNIFSNGVGGTGLDIECPEENGQNLIENVAVLGVWSGPPIKWIGAENSRFKNLNVLNAGSSPACIFNVPGGSIYFDDCQVDNISGQFQLMTLLDTTLNSFMLTGNAGVLLLDNCYQANAFAGTRFSTNGYTLQSFISNGTWHGLSNSSSLFGGGGGAGGSGGCQIRYIRMKAYIVVLDSTTCAFTATSDSNGYPYSYYVDLKGTQLDLGSGAMNGPKFSLNNGYIVGHGGYYISTPAVPASGTPQKNNFAFPVRVYLKTGGTGTAYAITDPAGNTETFTTTLTAGKEITLDPGASITLTYSSAPTWSWYGE